MTRVLRYLYSQFHKPRGPLGVLAGRIMSKRSSNNARSEWTVDLLALRPTDRVLEIGFGPGIGIAAALAKLDDGGELVGLDHSATMCRMARRRISRLPAECAARATLRVADVSADLPRDIGEFDAVFSCNVWLFWSDPGAVLGRLHAIIRPGGSIAVTHLPRHGTATAADALTAGDTITEQLAAAGFRNIRREMLPLDPVPAVCVLADR